MPLTTNRANAVVNYITDNVPISFGGSNWYIGLSTEDIGPDSYQTIPDSSLFSLGRGYSRKPIGRTTADWNEPLNGEVTNTNEVEFFNNNSSEWGVMKSIFVAESQSGSGIWFYTKISPPLHINGKTRVKFSPNSLAFKLENPNSPIKVF